ncbi:hypothetical protein F4819DRAFT_470480 [Hypoxylon fuscum]|nr:hypothetical protein F4819DRAFT_470480 [Hypoxylon fuscum]
MTPKSSSSFDRSMQPRHLHLIAPGESIGASSFVGSGSTLATGVSRKSHFPDTSILCSSLSLCIYSC